MPTARALGLAAFGVAAAGGAALGFLAERSVAGRAVGPGVDLDPYGSPRRGRPLDVVSADGTRLAVEVGGTPDGPTVLLVHGMALGQEVWTHQRAALESDHRVVTFDLRGHGASAPAVDGRYSARALGDDVVAVLQAVDDSRPLVVVGHSIGGMSVLAALRHHPEVLGERLAGLGFVASAGSDVLAGMLRSASAVGASMVQSAFVQSPAARWLRRRLEQPRGERVTDLSMLLTRHFGLSSDADPDAVAFVDRLNRRTPASVLGAMAQTLTTVDELDVLDAIDVPSLVVVGGDDRLTPPSQAQRLAERLVDIDLIEVPGAGHTVMVEAPEVVSLAIRGLVERSGLHTHGRGA